MKRILIIGLFLFVSSNALAGGYTKPTPNPWATTVNVNHNEYFQRNRNYTTKNYTTNNTTNNVDRSINQDQQQQQQVSNVGNSSHETDFDDYPVATAFAVAGSLLECPDTSGAAGVQTRNIGFSFGINNKDDDCAKIRTCQGLLSMYPESPRINAICSDMVATLDIVSEIEQMTGKGSAHYLAIPMVVPVKDLPLTKEEKTEAFIKSLETK